MGHAGVFTVLVSSNWGHMGVYKKDKAGTKWRVVIHLGDGNRQDWIVEGSNKDAVAFEARKRVELEAGKLPEFRAAPTFSDFCSLRYKPFAEVRLKARTWKNRTYTIANLVAYFGSYRLTEIKRPLVEQYQNQRIKDKVKASTINDEIKVLRLIMRYALANGVTCGKVDFPDLPVRGKRKIKAWTKEEVATLLRSIHERSPDVFGLVLFLLNTGCRKGEALALEWHNVDLRKRMIRIEPSEEWQPKDNEAREIPISDRVLLYFNAMHKHKRWVFPSDTGERYAFWPQRAFDRARKAAGLKGGPHMTRHTYASHFLTKQPDLYLLAEILGHTYTTVTDLYAHLLPDHLARALNAVDFGIDLV